MTNVKPHYWNTLQSRNALEMISLAEFMKLNNTFGELNEQ